MSTLRTPAPVLVNPVFMAERRNVNYRMVSTSQTWHTARAILVELDTENRVEARVMLGDLSEHLGG